MKENEKRALELKIKLDDIFKQHDGEQSIFFLIRS